MEKVQKVLGLPDLKATFLLICSSFRCNFIVIDALNECEVRQNRKYFLQVLEDLGRSSVGVFITSQPYPGDIKHEELLDLLVAVRHPTFARIMSARLNQPTDNSPVRICSAPVVFAMLTIVC
jgi:hypothetical protein